MFCASCLLQPSLKEYAGGVAAGAAGLQPLDLRFTSVLQGFQTLRCSLDVDLATPVPKVRCVESSINDQSEFSTEG